MAKGTRTIRIGRDAKTGRIVSPSYVKSHPKTTTTETRTVKRK